MATAQRRERSWSVNIEGYPEVFTDDLTLDEAAIAEQVSGVPYSLMNPHASAKVAKALLALLAIRAGMPEQKAIDYAGAQPLKVLHGAFTFHPGTTQPTPPDEGEPDPPSSAPTSAGG